MLRAATANIGYLITLARLLLQEYEGGVGLRQRQHLGNRQKRIRNAGRETFVIGNKPNGLNINRDCGSTHIERMQMVVRETIWMWASPLMATRIAVSRWMSMAMLWTGT